MEAKKINFLLEISTKLKILFNGLGDLINFTLFGPDGSELKDSSIYLKSGNYYMEAVFWNETSQSYNVTFDCINDLILYSENIFDNYLYANYDLDWDLNWDAEGSDYYAFAKHASQDDPLVLTYQLQQEKTAFMNIIDKDMFILTDYLNYSEVYCYLYNNETERYDIKHNFGGSDFGVYGNGSVFWSVNFTEYNVRDNVVIFTYYGSDYVNIIKDTQKNGMFIKMLVPNIYSTHCTIDTLQILFRCSVQYYRDSIH